MGHDIQMKSIVVAVAVAVAVALACAACGAKTEPAPAPHATAPAVVLDGAYVGAIREAADAYAKWGRVDLQPKVAPTLCAAAAPPSAGGTGDGEIRVSQAGDDSPHARKLYYLYASDRGVYAGSGEVPVGFTIVKESYTPRIPTHDELATGVPTVALDDGSRVTSGARMDLFVMTKVEDHAAPGTDAGWIYGTVAPDGRVTSSGRVGTCMGCHVEDATRERLFGLR
jgi:hypothetical protein